MPTISGNLNLVTDRPVDSISEVWVRARETRGQGDGLVVGVNDRVTVTDGAVEFAALPGAAVLVIVQNGMPIETLPMMVGDEAQQTLRHVVQAGEVVESATAREIEQLAAEFAASIALAEQYRAEAASSASAAQSSESAAATSESNAKTSENSAKQSETNAGDFAAVAATAATEAVDAMDAAALSAAAFSIYTGIGSPEGRVEAPVGSVYTDSAATNGAIRWIKTSGTGDTGWEVEYGDTGWRDITSLIPDPPSGGQLRLRRVTNTLYLQTSWLNTGSEGFTIEASKLRDEWAPASNSGGVLVDSGGRQAGHFRYTFSGRLVVTKTNGNSLDGVVPLLPRKMWPDTLPGTPA